jgi:hypothetical protein
MLKIKRAKRQHLKSGAVDNGRSAFTVYGKNTRGKETPCNGTEIHTVRV